MPLLWKTSILLAISHDSNILPAHLPHLPSRGGHICWNRIGDEHLNKTSDIIYTHASVVADGTLTDISDVRATKLTASSGRKPMPGRKESRPAGRLGRDISPHERTGCCTSTSLRISSAEWEKTKPHGLPSLPPSQPRRPHGTARHRRQCMDGHTPRPDGLPEIRRRNRLLAAFRKQGFPHRPHQKNRRKTFLLNNLPFHVHSTLWQTSTNCSFAP